MYSFTLELFNSPNLKENCLNDYELIKSFYPDSLEPIKSIDDENTNFLIFKLNLKCEMEIDSNIREIIENLKISNLISNDNLIQLPFWLKFNLDFEHKFLYVQFYVPFMKKKFREFENFKDQYLDTNYLKEIEESIFFSISESFKEFVKLPEKSVLLNWLQEVKEENIIKTSDWIPIDEIIYNKFHMNLNQDKEDNNSDLNENEEKGLNFMKMRSDKKIEKMSQIREKLGTTSNNNNENNNDNLDEKEYNNFFKMGGVVGDIITDRGSTFQSHAIKVKSINEMKKYLQDLKTNNKIIKAAHNILAYRIIDSNISKNDSTNNKIKNKKTQSLQKEDVLEGFDEDGENGAGIRMLGILQKMNVVNVMLVCSRWFGGTLIGQDRFKHINDSAKNLILSYKNIFEFQS